MKKWIAGIITMSVLVIAGFATVASAQTFRSGETSTVASGETVDGSAFLAGSTVDVAGTVNGDVYCAGQTITISGNVKGDVLCAGQTVNVTGTVAGDVRLAGQTVTLSGSVAKNATIAGQTIAVDGSGKVGQDLVLLGQSATLSGTVGRDVTIASSSATLSSTVGRNVSADIQTLTLSNSASIKGTLDYTGPQKLTMNDGAKVGGKVTYTERHQREWGDNRGFNFAGAIMGALMLIVTALLFALLIPRVLHDTTAPTVATPSRALVALGVGLVASIVIPIAAIAIMFTVFAIPFALIALLAWLLVAVVSGIFSSYYLGRVIWRDQNNAILTTLVGSLALAVLMLIPIINVFVWLLSLWYGSGAVLLRLKDSWPAAGPGGSRC